MNFNMHKKRGLRILDIGCGSGFVGERFILNGRNVFARHVIIADCDIRPGEEVLITNSKNRILAVGKATLSGKEMLAFNRGVAVKVRTGSEEQKRKKTKVNR